MKEISRIAECDGGLNNSSSTIPGYSKALRLEDLEGLTFEELQLLIFDLDHEKRELEGNLKRTRDQLNQLSAGLTRVLEQ